MSGVTDMRGYRQTLGLYNSSESNSSNVTQSCGHKDDVKEAFVLVGRLNGDLATYKPSVI